MEPRRRCGCRKEGGELRAGRSAWRLLRRKGRRRRSGLRLRRDDVSRARDYGGVCPWNRGSAVHATSGTQLICRECKCQCTQHIISVQEEVVLNLLTKHRMSCLDHCRRMHVYDLHIQPDDQQCCSAANQPDQTARLGHELAKSVINPDKHVCD